ncbi:MAG: COG4315 family predicted lipoprotein [Solirubrobacteraceae bacterium]
MRIKTGFAIGALALASLLAAAVSAFAAHNPSMATDASAKVVVSTRSVGAYGQILVNSKGHALYMFVPDKQKKVTCVSAACTAVWPPLKLASGAKAVASGGAKASRLGSDADPAGGRVVTYDHWPLYTYAGDTKAGVAAGQALNVNGGLWYVLSASGMVIKKKP